MKQQHLNLPNELIIDNFAGGGGASTGIEAAFGRPVDVAINHDSVALAMHAANHPETRHYCESVWDIDPIKVTGNQPVGLVWLSPDCKHFSKAKGGKPVEKKIRGLAWVALRWAAKCKPRVIMLENVEEFKTWGPLLADDKGNLKPDSSRKGETFKSFVRQLEAHGYKVEFNELRACDFGAPTIRKRFFMVARRDGLPICWPEPTHGSSDSKGVANGSLLPWRTAGDCIDWSIPCPSIFERNKPLADATLKRIAKGIKRYVIEAERPFVLDGFYAAAFLSKYFNTSNVGSDLNAPMPTVTAIDHNALVVASMIKFNTGAVGSSLFEPVKTITAGGTQARPGTACTMGIVTSNLIKANPQVNASKIQRVRNFLSDFGEENVSDAMICINGQNYQIVDIGLRMLSPRELFHAQGFPVNYIIGDDESQGLSLPKYAQVRMCGNSVPPNLSEALIRANFKHEHKIYGHVAA